MVEAMVLVSPLVMLALGTVGCSVVLAKLIMVGSSLLGRFDVS